MMLALLSGAAAGIHAAVVPEHFEEYWIYGGFFAALTTFQATWAIVILRRPTTPVAAVGIFANTAVLLLWVLSRTAGLPVGAEPWTPEAVGGLDVAAGLAEVGVVALALRVTPPFVVKRERHRAALAARAGQIDALLGTDAVPTVVSRRVTPATEEAESCGCG